MNSDLFISKEASIKDALNQLSASGMKCLLVVKKDNFLLGTIKYLRETLWVFEVL